MKTISIKISDETHKLIVNYKMDNKFKKLDDTIESIIKNFFKGGK